MSEQPHGSGSEVSGRGAGEPQPQGAAAWQPPRGPLAWMAQNPVAANLLMLVLLLGGVLMLFRIKQEVFPEFALDMVVINVAYPGASPAEVEQGVVLATEEAVRAVDGIKEVRSTASEGVGVVTVELMLGTDPDRALADVKSSVDRITSYPQDIERPVVSLAQRRTQVVSAVVYGDQPEQALRTLADRMRDELLDLEGITLVELAGVRPLEISIEVSRENLRRYDLTLEQIASRVSQASVDVPGGGVKTRGGEVLVRTTERREWGEEFGEIVVVSRPDGTGVKLRDIATIKDAFRDTDQQAFFNGERAVMIQIFRVGTQKPLEVSKLVTEYVESKRAELPPGVGLSTWSDMSEIYADRVNLLGRNAALGICLVLLVLGLFLEIRLAFWVTLGIPISFLGGLLFMPAMDTSINMISLFAFIVALGIVVDDAIVVGEAVYKHRTDGKPPLRAAIDGVREVGVPVTFAVLTTIVAFAPMLFVPGIMGKFFRFIPIVVITVFLVSLVESLFILPAHLAHTRAAGHGRGLFGSIHRFQQRFSRFVEWLIERTYVPSLERAVRYRYLTLAAGAAMLLATVGFIAGGHINFTFMPKVDGDVITAELTMPYGTSVRETEAATERIVRQASSILQAHGGPAKVGRGVFSQVGAAGSMRHGPNAGGMATGGHLGEVSVFLVPLDDRSFSTADFAREWRERIGEIAGADSLRVSYNIGASAGSPVEIELSHRDLGVLEEASAAVAARLKQYAGVYDIDDGFSPGKEQLDFTLSAGARALGVTEIGFARQIRSAFYGAEAARQQRGRDEVRAYVRLPERERRSEHDIEELLIRTPQGGEIPIEQAATVTRGRSYTQIQRRDGRRITSVTADVDTAATNASKVVRSVQAEVLPDILARYPGLTYSLEGEQRQQRESNRSLMDGGILAVLAIFGLLAVAFRSYVQPVIIMLVIPFGIVGALLGHVLMGYEFSLMSIMGLVALSGIVVNDSLILVVAINELRRGGANQHDAIVRGGARRFRPIILTSLTTFFGLMPMILETSVQARFLIPMAISLGFGVLFATFVTLILVPALYAIVDDLRSAGSRSLRILFPHVGSDSGEHPVPTSSS